MKFRLLQCCFIIFLFSCRTPPKPNPEADIFGNDSIIVSTQFFDNTKEHHENYGARRIREDSLGYSYIFRTPDCKIDSENIIGKIMCGTVIHGEIINKGMSVQAYKIFVEDKDSREGVGYIKGDEALFSFEFMKDSACRIPENQKLAADSNCDNLYILVEGIYLGKNLIVQNAFNCNGIGYCVYEVRVNDIVTTDIISKPRFEVDLHNFALKVGDPVEVKIFHKGCCMPKVLNPEVLKYKK